MDSILVFTLCNGEETVRVSLLEERNYFNVKVHFIFNLKCQRIIILMIYTIIVPTCLHDIYRQKRYLMTETKFLSLNVETKYGLGVRTLQKHWGMRKWVMQF